MYILQVAELEGSLTELREVKASLDQTVTLLQDHFNSQVKYYSNCAADQRLRFRHKDRTILLLPKSEISAFSYPLWLHSPVCVGPGGKH